MPVSTSWLRPDSSVSMRAASSPSPGLPRAAPPTTTDRVGPEDEFACAPNGPGPWLPPSAAHGRAGSLLRTRSHPHPPVLPRMGSQLFEGFVGVGATRRQERALLVPASLVLPPFAPAALPAFFAAMASADFPPRSSRGDLPAGSFHAAGISLCWANGRGLSACSAGIRGDIASRLFSTLACRDIGGNGLRAAEQTATYARTRLTQSDRASPLTAPTARSMCSIVL